MNKPMILVKEELNQKIIELINGSQLPPFIVEPVLTNILAQVREAVVNEYNAEKSKYEEALNNENDMKG